jgi:hypothetical protein
MGAEASCKMGLPPNVDEMESELSKTWTHHYFWPFKRYAIDVSTTAQYISDFFLDKHSCKKFLEVFCGGDGELGLSCKSKMKDRSWKQTDAPHERYKRYDAVSAVKKFGQEADVLVLCCPPTSIWPDPKFRVGLDYGFEDYFACKRFLAQEPQKQRFVVFIGELGGYDGTEGMYRYLHQAMTLRLHKEIYKAPLRWGEVFKSRDLFIFENIIPLPFQAAACEAPLCEAPVCEPPLCEPPFQQSSPHEGSSADTPAEQLQIEDQDISFQQT